jgi:hypothetical protein
MRSESWGVAWSKVRPLFVIGAVMVRVQWKTMECMLLKPLRKREV